MIGAPKLSIDCIAHRKLFGFGQFEGGVVVRV
jgi:hypothetical protein